MSASSIDCYSIYQGLYRLDTLSTFYERFNNYHHHLMYTFIHTLSTNNTIPQVKDFVSRFMPAYSTYLPKLYRHGPQKRVTLLPSPLPQSTLPQQSAADDEGVKDKKLLEKQQLNNNNDGRRSSNNNTCDNSSNSISQLSVLKVRTVYNDCFYIIYYQTSVDT